MDNTFAETERLILRQMSEKDFSDIAEMLKNPNVMYAWEYVFDDIDASLEKFRCKIYRIEYVEPKAIPVSGKTFFNNNEK